jgi:hypothetical protein
MLADLIRLFFSLISPVLTLSSVQQIDDYPLYTMRYYGSYEQNIAFMEAASERLTAQAFVPDPSAARPAWGCSLFTAFADPDNALYGRNFDWEYSPALLLFADPPDGYASVAMVDIAYLGFGRSDARRITDMSLAERAALIYAPLLPFDGMNEHGLAIGMAAVSSSPMPTDPNRETIGSLGIMREVLDHARTVDEAVAIFEQYNIDMAGGPPIHYLIADATGQSVLIEFWEGGMVVTPNTQPWDMATNFIRASAQSRTPESMCWRYRTISETMSARTGQLTADGAMALLQDVSQGNTQWSIVYSMASGEIHVAMRRQYDGVHTLHFSLAERSDPRERSCPCDS